jgi:hypothetical protein
VTTSRADPEPATDSAPAASGAGGPSARREHALALAAALITFGVLAGLYLYPYVTDHFRYPTGWDAPTAVGRAQLVSAYGLDRFGAIRSGVPLLLTILKGVTRQNALTLVAMVPAVLLGVAALGGAALACAALGIRAWWLPILGFLFWAAFGENGMLNLHLDNMLNASMVLPGFAAAVGFVVWRKGALAAAILLAAAGLAHWPFYIFAVAILLVALAADLVWSRRSDPADPAGTVLGLAPMIGAVAASGGFVALTFLWVSPTGWTGARLRQLGSQLRERFFDTLADRSRYYALPTAGLGALAAARSRPRSPRSRGWRLFLCLMGSWTVVTIAGGIAQALRLPTAGAREIHYFFPASILTGLAVWWAARWMAGRWRGPLGLVAAGALVAVAIGGFGALFWAQRSNDRPWFKQPVMAQAAAAAAYLETVPGDRPIVFVLDVRATAFKPAFQQIKAAIGPTLAQRSYAYWGLPADYLAGVLSRPNGRPQPTPPQALPGGGADPLVIVLNGFNSRGFEQITADQPEIVIADGVAVLRGPLPATPLAPARTPLADTRPRALAWTLLSIVLFLFAAGGGWAVALLPDDPVLRVALAPALGAAAVTLLAFAWDRLGLTFAGQGPVAVAVLAAAPGWGLAAAARLRVGRSGRGTGSVPES